MLKKAHQILLLFLFPSWLFAQEIPDYQPEELSTAKIYTDLTEIALHPDSVLYIDLSKQKLESIPDAIFECKNLVYLDLKRNKIEEIPTKLKKLDKLRVLNMSRNRLTRLPKEIGQCMQLRTLILNQNEMVEVCPEIGLLTNLIVLDLWGNQVTRLPKEIAKLSETLKYLDMRVIYMSHEAQETIELMLPETTIYFSQGCNCKD